MKIRDCVGAGMLALGLLGAAGAQAAIYTFDFAGIVDAGSAGVIVGSPFTGSLTYDTDAPATYVYTTDGIIGMSIYTGVLQTFYASGSGITVESTGMLSIVVSNTDTIDVLKVFGPSSAPGGYIELYLNDPTGSAFSSMNLPTSLSVADFPNNHVYFWNEHTGIDGHLIDPSSTPGDAVPEPATWALMIAGFGLAGAGLRSARRRGAVAA